MDRLADSVKGARPVRCSYGLPHKDVFYYSDSADFAKKNNTSPPMFIFKRQVYKGKTYSNYLDSIFNRSDIDFFLQQIEAFTPQKEWLKPFKKSYLVKESDVIDKTNYHRVKGGKVILNYCLPVFSVDKRKAILIKGFYCGLLCCGGAITYTRLTKKMNG
jgi:hypothetical protein